MTREPLISAATVVAAAAAVIGVLVEFGFDLTSSQQTALLTVVGVFAPIAVALASRRKVTPVADPLSADNIPLVPVVNPPEEPPAP